MFTSVSLFGRHVVESGGRLGPALHFSSSSLLRSAPEAPRPAGSQESTFNQAEVDKFAAMASSWWDPTGVCRPLHSMNRLRVPLVREGLLQSGLGSEEQLDTATPLLGLSVLDVGCGAGLLSEPLARIGARVVGIDACPENVEAARRHAELDPGLAERLSYSCATVEQHLLDHPESPYDCVVASEVVEHVDNQQVFVSKCSELLRPGGSLFLTTINRTNRSWLLAILGAEYVIGLLPRGTHQWEKFVTPAELSRMAESSGCSPRAVQGMAYLPWSNSWAWVPDCSVNYALHAVKH